MAIHDVKLVLAVIAAFEAMRGMVDRMQCEPKRIVRNPDTHESREFWRRAEEAVAYPCALTSPQRFWKP